MTNSKRVLIVGGGTFGLSTAYHLAKSGYTNVTVLDKGAYLPSDASAGNDLNKIIRAEYEDPFYAELALDAIQQWQRNPLFAPYYHQVGYLLATSPAAPEKAKKSLAKALSSISRHPAWAGQITPLETREDIRAVAPAFDGPMKWRGYFNRLAGYAHAADALRATYAVCCELGIEFRLGDAVKSLTWDGDRCVGASTASGRFYGADVVVVTMGGAAASLIPSLAPQVTAKAWSVAHVQLTPAEAAKLRGIPVTYARDLGFFFEPDPRTNLLKMCPSGAGITNYEGGNVSLPPADSSYIPAHDEAAMRALLRETLPALADRPLVNQHMCWVADTRDSEYIIDFVPGKKGVIVATGDSGHGYKMLPVAGRWIKKVIEEGAQAEARWRWKEVSGGPEDISWRVGNLYDLKEESKKIVSKL
ncbi:related to fructosyl amino acid oxidase [Cephalotrichum gorgonifer]|uniref:Related to fructosyl amino acid oxidase n=1 Tax=Cephalotrichum gorgonifer TaxID=2041049 RepID=A0AAE8MVF6_9PEZI|nr:related to fructosyl amino acid oxidase [Cephalotrichum gorgonifer]